MTRAAVVATSFDATLGADGGQPVERTGNPVRAAILAHRETRYEALDAMGPIRLRVFGGSLGARVFSDLVPASLALLPSVLRDRIELVQQCRPEDLEPVRDAYDALGIKAEIAPFFDDVPNRLANAHLVIARAGASTVSELGVIGRPAILVPYPHAMDDHQSRNAKAMENAGGGWMMGESDLTAETLAARLEALLGAPERLQQAAAAAHGFGVPDAVDRLADLVLRVAARNGNVTAPTSNRDETTGSGLAERRALA